MQDTSESPSVDFPPPDESDVSENMAQIFPSFDPLLQDREFIAEMRQRLTLLSIRVNGDLPHVESCLQSANRRIGYLEKVLPDLQARQAEQGKQINDLIEDFTVYREILASVVTAVAEQRQTPWYRLRRWFAERLAGPDCPQDAQAQGSA